MKYRICIMNLSPFKLERFFAKYEFKAPYLLCTSDCESLTFEELINLDPSYLDRVMKFRLGYINTDGQYELRELIADMYDSIKPDNIVVTNGAEESIYLFMNVALKKGEHIIIQYPFYQSLGEIAKYKGVNVSFWELEKDREWRLNLEYLIENIRDNTSVIVLNMPHNPTGFIVDKKTFTEIINIAREKNIMVLNDEVYNGLEYDPNDRLPYICDLYENGVSIGGLSKAYGLAGLRIGWIASKNKNLINEINYYKDFTTICNSGISELLAIFALKNRDFLLKRNLAIVKENLKILDEFFKRHKEFFNYLKPKGGTIAFPELKTGEDVEKFCIELVNNTGVLLLPGNYYDYDNRHFRIGFGRKNMIEALTVFENHLKKLFKSGKNQ
ncbi:MAG: aminotransferase class I/II-fold pyridoxal phosphate-dependent enzyme [Deltaproteobacteria bacterium]|nr:aminotransferase class I/II-fold pyridoxal phosphate-dependent enzyme [Deltaproteobacteria bacterium]